MVFAEVFGNLAKCSWRNTEYQKIHLKKQFCCQGIDKAVVFGFPWRDLSLSKMNNDHVLEAVAKYPDRFIGFCCMDPSNPGAEKEAERCFDEGLAGIGELAFYGKGIEGSDLDNLEPFMILCREKESPIMIHTNEPVGHIYPGKTPNTLAQIYGLIKRYPENRIVLAHWGGGIFFYMLLKKEVREAFKNIYFDTAASPYLYSPAIYRYALGLAGAEKILFGSDFPLLKPSRYVMEFSQAGLQKEEIEKICGQNAAALLKL